MHVRCRPCTARPTLPSGAALAFALAVGLAVAGKAHADQPLWELGVGAAGLRIPHYRGSDQSHSWLLPVPYFVYRGKILRSDRQGTRAVLLDSERFDFDISVDASPPTKGGDNRARAGMPDLSATFEIGPKLNVTLAKGADWKLDLRVPVRAAFTAQSHARGIGWTTSPVINLDIQAQGWNIGVQGGLLAATRRYNAYFYDVAPAYATSTRAAYSARSGSAGWVLTTSASRRLGDWWLAGYASADSLAGATFSDSPLVRKRNNLSYGVAASWIFKVSETRVADSR